MDIKQIYDALSAALPKEAVQRSDGKETGKGYNTTGYGYQFIVNRFNEVLGIGNWNWAFKETDRLEGSYKSGTKFIAITGEATISIKIGEEMIEHTEIGGHQSNNLTDAKKGASTNAFKKTAAFFGVGKQAFEKLIDEDNSKPDPNKDFKKTSTVEKENSPKATLQDTISLIRKIKKIETVAKWREQLETSEAWNEAQKRVIEQALEERENQINGIPA